MAEPTHPPPPDDPETVRQVTDALLDERRFRDGMNLGRAEDVQAFFDRLEDVVVGVINFLIDLQETHPFWYGVLVVGLVLLAAFLVWHIVYTVRRGSRGPSPVLGRALSDLVTESSVEALRRRVRLAEQQGDLAEALRLRFAVAVAEVVGLPRLRAMGHLTFRELAREVAHKVPGVAWDPVLRTVEETTYAGAPLDETEYRRCLEILRRGRAR